MLCEDVLKVSAPPFKSVNVMFSVSLRSRISNRLFRRERRVYLELKETYDELCNYIVPVVRHWQEVEGSEGDVGRGYYSEPKVVERVYPKSWDKRFEHQRECRRSLCVQYERDRIIDFAGGSCNGDNSIIFFAGSSFDFILLSIGKLNAENYILPSSPNWSIFCVRC